MDQSDYICPKCGAHIGIGDWPYCPHGKPYGMHTFRAYLDQNIAPEPVWITSHAQRKRLLRENSADYKPAGAGMPGCEV
jgi:hypothetical protein